MNDGEIPVRPEAVEEGRTATLAPWWAGDPFMLRGLSTNGGILRAGDEIVGLYCLPRLPEMYRKGIVPLSPH